ncbi:Dishevelled [Trema orientale]|uniref:Dishevelled n=1 Tax=Trema orientale TaxID=63057 RepID=A0A2P5G1X6_TREOI|nr:Dishevelled [Trema orientale]
MESKESIEKDVTSPLAAEKLEGEALVSEKEKQREPVTEMESLDINKDRGKDESVDDVDERQKDAGDKKNDSVNIESKDQEESVENGEANNNLEQKIVETKAVESNDETLGEEEHQEPVFDGTEVPGMEASRSTSTRSLDLDSETQKVVDKAVALKNLVKEKGAVAVSTFLRRLSGRKDEEGQDVLENAEKNASESAKDDGAEEASQKTAEKSAWNPLNYITLSREVDPENSEEKKAVTEETSRHIVMKGRIILYTRLGCQDCKEARQFLHRKRLKYVEINIDVYPSRKLELEKIAGSSAVPKVFFNEILVGGLSELKGLDETGKLDEKIDYLITEAPSFEAPLPPLSGEDDMSSSGAIDELALVVRKMRESIIVKDRFYKMRRFTNCFLGSEAVDFLSEDQYLEREEATEFGRKLAGQLFFQHVLGENLFEDSNHLYRFLDDDPIVSECHNIPRGLTDVKPKPIIEIASRLRFLSYAIFEAYTSEDGKHVDYISIHGSEEFARYLRIVEELQRVELQDISREEKLAFFINLYNMMVIHAILLWGHPAGALERRRLFGDFRYVVGGSSYSLSAIQNGILRGNQRPPYNLMKPFSAKDKHSKVALPYPEPLIHFALVSGNQSGPTLRCYSPGNIDKELMESTGNFLRSGGVIIDFEAKVASVSKILKWFSIDFGKNEVEVLKFVSNYLDQAISEALLEFLAKSQFKVIYQPYDWRLNC